MKRSTLISDLAIRYKYLNHAQVEKMVELVFKHLGNALSQDQRIEIRGIGTWHVKTRNPRLARNPRTGEKVQVGIKKNIIAHTNCIQKFIKYTFDPIFISFYRFI